MKYNFIKHLTESDTNQEALRVNISDLTPVLSEESVDFHYNALYRNYITASADDPSNDFAIAGAELHKLFFEQFKTPSTGHSPSGASKALFLAEFRGFLQFKQEFTVAALGIQGSGWCYLSTNGTIQTIPNHELRDDILFIIDMWEHSWVLDYTDKEEYLHNMWKIIDWEVINNRIK